MSTIENLDQTEAARNKATVQRAFAALVATGDADVLASALTDDFVHHRPDADRSREAWLDAVRRAMVPLAGMEVEIDHLLADGDHVVMHSRRRFPDRDRAITVVDVWRFEQGRIAEAWEVIEPDAEGPVHFTWWV
ncbi:nuclear transport factor 2 family protein [Luteimicrobium sp. NPDC057192]|uniref:nuclear transport factor 2 family protein n=1 Tax=Luteimicrobium sp. NPDC057192 TaxID=3346042 RepID=UPI00363B2378